MLVETSATLKPCSRSLAPSRLAVSSSLKAPTCTQYTPVAAGVAVLAAAVFRGSDGFFAAGFVFADAEVSDGVLLAALSVVTAGLLAAPLFAGVSAFGVTVGSSGFAD